jgi:hypothetical protein
MVKEKTKALFVAGKDSGLKLNSFRTKYMPRFQEQKLEKPKDEDM